MDHNSDVADLPVWLFPQVCRYASTPLVQTTQYFWHHRLLFDVRCNIHYLQRHKSTWMRKHIFSRHLTILHSYWNQHLCQSDKTVSRCRYCWTSHNADANSVVIHTPMKSSISDDSNTVQTTAALVDCLVLRVWEHMLAYDPMSTGYGWEGIRQVCATLLGACHVPAPRSEAACLAWVRYNKLMFILPCLL